MILTTDASVAVKWIVDEPGSEKARGYLPVVTEMDVIAPYILIAPSLILLEIHNTLAKKYRRREVDFQQVNDAHLTVRYFGALEKLDKDLIQLARRMSLLAGHWSERTGAPSSDSHPVFNVYDCVYIAHAQRSRSTLLTCDAEQARVARAFDVPVEWLGPA